MFQEYELTVQSMIRILEGEGLNVTVENTLDLLPDHLMYYKIADENSLCFYEGNDASQINHLNKCVLICNSELKDFPESITVIKTENPKLAYYVIAEAFSPAPPPPGVHPTAIVSPEAVIHPSAYIGPYCVLEKCSIGENVLLRAHVCVYSDVHIGKNTVVEANTTLGPYGPTWAWKKNGERVYLPSVGNLRIGEECIIGSNVTIVRGGMDNTLIGNKCLIGHGCRIGHDSHIDDFTHFASGIAIAGNTHIGKRCFIGCGVSTRSYVIIGDNTVAGNGAVIVHNHPDGNVILVGNPAKPLNDGYKERRIGMPRIFEIKP